MLNKLKTGWGHRRRFGLDARILAIVLAALLPVLVAVGYNELALRQQREVDVKQQALAIAEQTALELQQMVVGTHELLEAIVASAEVRGHLVSQCEDLLAKLAARFPQYLSLGVLDASGTPFCRDDRSHPNLNFADRPYFEDAMAAPGTMIVADYTVSRVNGAQVLPLALSFSDDTGKASGVAVASLDLKWLAALLKNRQISPGGSLTIADRNGVIIGREPLPEKFVGTSIPDVYLPLVHASVPGVEEVHSQDGTERYLGYVPVSVQPIGLYVSAGLSKNVAFAQINDATWRTLLLLALGLAVAVLLSSILSRRFVLRPIERITGAIERRRSGDETARTGLHGGRGDLEDLGFVFDQYMDELNRSAEQRLAAEQQRDIVVRELAHRIKNLFATVQAVASQTFRGDGDPKDMRRAFEGRLAAMANAQDLLLQKGGEPVTLRATVETAIMPFEVTRGDRFDMDGPDLPLRAGASAGLSMIIHELCTNAVKYGALSETTGRVRVTWSPDGERLKVVWHETGGPPAREPARTGFGSQLIERTASAELQGRVSMLYTPEGLVCEIIAQQGALDP